MKRFRFTLDAVRDLRREAETSAMQALADGLRERAAAAAIAERARQRQAAADEHVRRPAGTAAALAQSEREREAARIQVRQSAIAVREGDRLVASARQGLVQARQALESIERLEERGRLEHRRRALQEDERLVAELVEARAARAAFLARRGGGQGRGA